MDREKAINILVFLLTMVVVIGIGIWVFQTMIQDMPHQEYCNEKYGEGNWYWKDITETEEAPTFYLGQTWKCVENKSQEEEK